VYIVDLWVANIGEDVHVLLGMDFMVRAGVRLCIREGLAVLPDEETILMYGDVMHKHQGIDQEVCPPEILYLRPGESTTVRIRYGQANPWRDVVWPDVVIDGSPRSFTVRDPGPRVSRW